MNRNYIIHDYNKIVEKLHKLLENFALSTDLIVGVPSESDKEYEETLTAVRPLNLMKLSCMHIHQGKELLAANLNEKLTIDQKKERLSKLITIQREISQKKLKGQIDTIEETIIERISKKSNESVMGRTFLNHPVIIPGSEKDIGKKITIKIHDVKGSTLQGIRIVLEAL